MVLGMGMGIEFWVVVAFLFWDGAEGAWGFNVGS